MWLPFYQSPISSFFLVKSALIKTFSAADVDNLSSHKIIGVSITFSISRAKDIVDCVRGPSRIIHIYWITKNYSMDIKFINQILYPLKIYFYFFLFIVSKGEAIVMDGSDIARPIVFVPKSIPMSLFLTQRFLSPRSIPIYHAVSLLEIF